MTVDDNYDMTNENGVMTTHLKFLYNDNTVGTTTLNISAAGTDTGSLLPYINNDVSSSYKPKTCIRINIWIQAKEEKGVYQLPTDICTYTANTGIPITEAVAIIAITRFEQKPLPIDYRELNIHVW